MKTERILLIVCLFLAMHTMVLAQKNLAGYYSYNTELLESELDGTLTLRAWGNGKNKKDAIQQAYKNAVYDILFNGITKNTENKPVKALVLEVNAREKYEDYFNSFFKDGGDYNKFVNNRDGRQKVTMGKKRSDAQVTCGIVVRVNRPKLKKELMKENIIR